MADGEPDPDSDADVDTEAETEADPRSAAEADRDPDADADADADHTTETDADPTAETDADPTAETDADPTAETDADQTTGTEHEEPDRLIAWSLGAFHAATLVAVLVALGHANGSLGNLLDGLNTVVGLALYLLLWVLSWRASHGVLARVPPAKLERGGAGAALNWGLAGGAFSGMAFFVVIALVAIAPAILQTGEPLSFGIILFIGLGVAGIVGAFVGGLFALLDVALFRVAGRLGGSDPE